jgi:superfamily II DNA/RNA helicase
LSRRLNPPNKKTAGSPNETDTMGDLRGSANILVATPGRLLNLIAHNAVNIAKVNCVVLDKADRLLDLGIGDAL